MNLSTPNVSAKMRRVHSTNTTPERLFRMALSQRGVRYNIYKKELPGKPDIVLPSKRLAIFIDGDLWHGGQWQRRRKLALEEQFGATLSKDYWLAKIRRNMERDCSATHKLLCAGWTVLRFWEREIYKNLEECVDTAITAINGTPATPLSRLPQKSFAEFFAGVGLMSMGLEREGWFADFANDIAEQKKEMYYGHFEEDWVPFIVEDVHN